MTTVRSITLLVLAWCCFAQSLDKPTNFHVKLSDPIGGSISKPGSRVGAVVISPESFLGGRFEGSVTQVSNGKAEVVFHLLRFKGKSWSVTTRTTGFVNSIGHAAVDEDERPLQLDNGVFLSAHADAKLDEGAELRLSVSPKAP